LELLLQRPSAAKLQPKAELTADDTDDADFLFCIHVIRVIRGKIFTKRIDSSKLRGKDSKAQNA